MNLRLSGTLIGEFGDVHEASERLRHDRSHQIYHDQLGTALHFVVGLRVGQLMTILGSTNITVPYSSTKIHPVAVNGSGKVQAIAVLVSHPPMPQRGNVCSLGGQSRRVVADD